MPYSVTWESKGVYCKFFGEVSVAEIRQMVDEVVTDTRFKNMQYRITDCLDVTSHALTTTDISQVLKMNEAYSFANARKYEGAIAIDTNVVSLLHHWASTSPRRQQLCIFSTVQDARKWLNHPGVV